MIHNGTATNGTRPAADLDGGQSRGAAIAGLEEKGKPRDLAHASQAEASPVELLQKLSVSLRDLSKAAQPTERGEVLERMQEEARLLKAAGAAGGSTAPGALSAALGKLFAALANDPEKVNPSNIRTISHAIDFLSSSNGVPVRLEGAPLQVLVLDDDEVCRRTLQLALKNADMDLTVCDKGERALEFLQKHTCDVVFTDVMMPEMDGFAFAGKLRKLPGHMSTPIIFITALSDFVTRSKSIMSGGCDLIAKPFTVGEIVVKAYTLGLKHRSSQSAASAGGPSQHTSKTNGAEDSTPSKSEAAPADEAAEYRRKMSRLNGVIVLDENGGITSMNEDCAELFGYAPRQAVGWPIVNLFPDELQSGEGAIKAGEMLAGNFKSKRGITMKGRQANGSSIGLSVNISGTETNGRRQFVGLIRWVAGEAPPRSVAEVSKPLQAPTGLAEPDKQPKAEPAIAEEDSNPLSHRNTLLVGAAEKRAESRSAIPAGAQLSLISAALNTSEQGQPAPAEKSRPPSLPVPEDLKSELRTDKAVRIEVQPAEAPAKPTLEPAAGPKEIKLPARQPEDSEALKQIEQLQLQLKEQTRELERLQAALQSEGALRTQAQKSEADLATAKAHLEKELNQCVTRAEGWERDQKALEELLRDESDLRKQANAQLAESQKRLGDLADQKQALEQRLAALQASQERQEDQPGDSSTEQKHLELEDRFREIEHARSELASRLDRAQEREELAHKTVQSLKAELDESSARFQSKFQDQATKEIELKNKCTAFELKVQALGEELSQARQWETAHQSLTTKLAATRSELAEQSAQRQRLEASIAELQLARSELTRKIEGARDRENLGQQLAQSLKSELEQTRTRLEKKIQEQCAREAELKSKCASLALQAESLEAALAQVREQIEQLEAANKTILREGRESLAGLRYAVLDAARVRAQAGAGQIQGLRQGLEQVQQVVAALLSTPLSINQRQLAASLKTHIEDALRNCSTKLQLDELHLEPFVKQNTTFRLAEVVNGAFEGGQSTAGADGLHAHVVYSEKLPQELTGDPAHLYQLVTLLADSTRKLAQADSLDLEISAGTESADQAGLALSLRAKSKANANDLAARFKEVIEASDTLALVESHGAEAELAVGWQLAQAMGGVPQCEIASENELLIRVDLPAQSAGSPA